MMNSEFDRNKIVPLARILFAVAVLLGALTFVKVAGFFVSSSKAKMLATRADPSGAGAVDLAGLLAQAKVSAEQLKKKNLFVLSPPKQYPIKEVLGILGDEVLVNGKWYKAGDSVGEAKIVAIEPTRVRIAWNGQEKVFAPIGAGSSGNAPDRRGAPTRRPVPRGGAPMVVTGQRGGPAQAGRSGPFMSQEKMEQLKSRWPTMSPEERQRVRDEMRKKYGERNR